MLQLIYLFPCCCSEGGDCGNRYLRIVGRADGIRGRNSSRQRSTSVQRGCLIPTTTHYRYSKGYGFQTLNRRSPSSSTNSLQTILNGRLHGARGYQEVGVENGMGHQNRQNMGKAPDNHNKGSHVDSSTDIESCSKVCTVASEEIGQKYLWNSTAESDMILSGKFDPRMLNKSIIERGDNFIGSTVDESFNALNHESTREEELTKYDPYKVNGTTNPVDSKPDLP